MDPVANDGWYSVVATVTLDVVPLKFYSCPDCESEHVMTWGEQLSQVVKCGECARKDTYTERELMQA